MTKLLKSIQAASIAIAIGLTMSTLARAAEDKAPASEKDCIALLQDLGPKVQKLPEATLMALRPKAQTVDIFCKGGRFADAFAVYKEIQDLIEGKK